MTQRRQVGSDRRRPAAELEPSEQLGVAGPARLGVKKTWKLFLGGAFVRSESGRYLVTADGNDNYPHASRKDARDAVKAAQGALSGWAGRSGYNRGQILYRLAEVMEGRREELMESLERGGASAARSEVDAAIDRAVSHAGWCDKLQSLLASSNPVAGPHFGFSIPEPIGVVAIAAPDRPSLLGLVGSICPVIVSGNVAVVVVSESDPRTTLVFAECLATSDMPGGVVNLLTGPRQELITPLAKHMAVRALDLWNVAGELAVSLERDAADNVKRVSRREADESAWFDAERGAALTGIERFVETKTVWHPMGA